MGNILFVDDEPSILKLAKRIFSKNFTVFTASNYSECLEVLSSHVIHVVISDYWMPDMDGVELLSKIKKKIPKSKRILVSGDLDLETAINSVNSGEAHKLVQKPWDYELFRQEISDLIAEYQKEEETNEQMEVLLDSVSKIEDYSHPNQQELLSVLSQINKEGNLHQYSEQLISAIEGLKSLAKLHTNLYLQNSEKESFYASIEYLNDIMYLGDQFGQKLLSLFANLIQSLLYINFRDYVKSRKTFNRVKGLLVWFKSTDMYPMFSDAINYLEKFPFSSKISKSVSTSTNDKVSSLMIEDIISQLYHIEINNLIILQDTNFDIRVLDENSIYQFSILKDDLPIFTYQKNVKGLNSTLVSSFVVALSAFLKEMVSGEGEIKNISHDRGEILVQSLYEFKFILLCESFDVRYRIGLRQLSSEIYPYLKNIKSYRKLNAEQSKFVTEQLVKMFGIPKIDSKIEN